MTYLELNLLAGRAYDWACLYALRNRMRSDLTGMCARASAALFHCLDQSQVTAQLCLSECDRGAHVFIKFDDYVVDVTARQFNEFRNSRWVIMHEREAERYWFYQGPLELFDSVAELRKYQIDAKWPTTQVCQLGPVL